MVNGLPGLYDLVIPIAFACSGATSDRTSARPSVFIVSAI